MILYVNACVRAESRTNRIAKALLEKLGDYTEVNLEKEEIKPLSSETLKLRDELLMKEDFSHPMLRYACQFKEADTIVIGAPFWDFSFPAALKIYIENICCVGLTFGYSAEGRPMGLGKAKKVYYVSSAGGDFVPDFGFNYISTVMKSFFSIREVELVSAEHLDWVGNDPEVIVQKKISEITL